jgi:hypothetical protein
LGATGTFCASGRIGAAKAEKVAFHVANAAETLIVPMGERGTMACLLKMPPEPRSETLVVS